MRQISAVHLRALCKLICEKVGDVYQPPSMVLVEGGRRVLAVDGEKGSYRAKQTERGIAVFSKEGELLVEIDGVSIDQPLPLPDVEAELQRAVALREEGQQLFFTQRRPGDALARYDEALRILRTLGDRRGERLMLSDRGLVQGALGQHQEAIASFQEAFDIGRELHETSAQGTIVNNIAAVYHGMGEFEEAVHRYEEALAIHRSLGDRENEQMTLNNMAYALEALGRSEEASRCRQQAARLEGEGPGTAGRET